MGGIFHGNAPAGTLRTDLPIYITNGVAHEKILKCFPRKKFFRMTFSDYAGELSEEFTEFEYKRRIEKLEKNLSSIDPVIGRNLDANIDSPDFLSQYLSKFRNESYNDFISSRPDIIYCFNYKRMANSDRFLFLIDADWFIDTETHEFSINQSIRGNLEQIFGLYNNMAQTFGLNKSFAFALTKADKIYSNLDSIDKEHYEKTFFNMLMSNTFMFHAVINLLKNYNSPIQLLLTSVDRVMLPLTDINYNPRQIPMINPWCFEDVIKFTLE